MRAILTLIIIVLVSLPSLFAGWPGIAPGWFDRSWSGLPMSVVAMTALIAVFVLLAGVCGLAARSGRQPGAGED